MQLNPIVFFIIFSDIIKNFQIKFMSVYFVLGIHIFYSEDQWSNVHVTWNARESKNGKGVILRGK